MATDSGNPALVGSATVSLTDQFHSYSSPSSFFQIVINVLDINDNTPLFENCKAFYNVCVKENYYVAFLPQLYTL